MPQFILALDQGTTSSRSILFDAAGTPVATAQREFTQHFPRSGWVEHDAEEIWATQAATIAEVLARARHDGRRRRGDRHHQPARDHGALGPPDRAARSRRPSSGRTGAPPTPAQQLKADGLEPEVARRTGLLLDPYFSGTKLAWLLDHVPGARARAPSAANSPSAPSTAGWSGSCRAARATSPTPPTPAARCCSTSRPASGTMRCSSCCASRARSCRRSSPRRCAGDAPRAPARRPRGAHRRHCRRPAGRAVRPGLLRARHGEEHLWHRLLPADEHRHVAARIRPTGC